MTFARAAPPAYKKGNNCRSGRSHTNYLIRRTQANQLSNKLTITVAEWATVRLCLASSCIFVASTTLLSLTELKFTNSSENSRTEIKEVKVAHTRTAERRVPELIPVLGSQPACDVSHKPGGRLPLLSTRPAVTPATLNRAATSFAAW